MNNSNLAKKWKSAEIMLSQAAEFLLEPTRFTLAARELEDYEQYIAANELGLAMEELEHIALEFGAKSGFWRRLKKAAIQMELADKSEEYEMRFHQALSNNICK